MLLADGAPDATWLDGPAVPVHSREGGVLAVTAGPRTDWFVDPAGVHVKSDAPVLLAPLAGAGTLAATVACAGRDRFDAAALYVFVGPDAWGKLALERNPLGEQTLVSVVTDGTSDDCNHRVVAPSGAGVEVRLRVTAAGGGIFAFHVAAGPGGGVGADGAGVRWDLLRYFALERAKAEPDAVRLGLSVQSPLGEGCTATFRDVTWSADVPADLRDGS